MNKLEKTIYNLVKNNVKLKNFVKDCYQRLFLLVNRPKRIYCNREVKIIEGYFFGFHDKTPWCSEDVLILAHKYDDSIKSVPKTEDKVEVGYFKQDDMKKFNVIDKTHCWNWQQGAMLQWVGEKKELIYNYWNGKKCVARIKNISGELVKEIPFSIGAISDDGRCVISYNFERLNRGMYGYGYANEELDSRFDIKNPDDQGFTVYDLNENKEIAFLSIKAINESLGEFKFNDGYLFVTHFKFSPDGERFFFLLRSYKKGKMLSSRLLTSDKNCTKLHILPTGKMVSHLTWVNSDKILAYCRSVEGDEGYYLFKDLSQKVKRIGEKYYSEDGHPQFNSVNDLIVTDTYPNRKRLQELSVYNLVKNEKEVIGMFFSPLAYKNFFRADLHPRWNRRGSKICIDTTYTKKRSISILNYK